MNLIGTWHLTWQVSWLILPCFQTKPCVNRFVKAKVSRDITLVKATFKLIRMRIPKYFVNLKIRLQVKVIFVVTNDLTMFKIV